MPRKIERLIDVRYVSIVFLGILMSVNSISLLEATAPAWSYHIEGITASAMSRNGNYIIVGTQEGYFYVLDRFGNVVRSDYARSRITTVDISETGTFFVGTDIGCYFSTIDGEPKINVDRPACFLSVSISDTAEFTIVGTEDQVYIFDHLELVQEERLRFHENYPGEKGNDGDNIRFTDISSSGNIAVAATWDIIALYHQEAGYSRYVRSDDKITSLAISRNGQTVSCGTEEGDIFIFESESFEHIYLIYDGEESINDLEMTENGDYVVFGTEDGFIGLLEKYGYILWQKKPMKSIESLSISDDGNLIAAVGSEKLCLFDGSGRILQEMTFPESLQEIFLSADGRYASCISTKSMIFFELSDCTFRFTEEYEYPSRKSIPLQDTLVRKKHGLENIADDYGDIQIADVNGDGKNEFVIVSSNSIIVAEDSGRELSRIEFSIKPELRRLLDVTGDLTPEIIVGHSDGRMAFTVYDGAGTLLASHEFYMRWELQPEDKCGIYPLAAADIDHDKKIEIICFVGSGYKLQPRGIYVFEYPSFSEEWFYAYAPCVLTPTVVDLDGNGDLEILLGSNAPCNGGSVGDTNDCHAYVAAIDSRGEELWIKEIGYGFKRVRIDVADLDNDGENEIVCGGWSFEDTWGKLFVLNEDGKYIAGEDDIFENSLFLGGVSDLDDDGMKEILTFSSNGNISIFDHLLNLKQEKKIEISMGKSTSAIINDIDADGSKEIILLSNDERVYILDNTLEAEWTESFPKSPNLVRAFVTNFCGCKNHLIILSNRMYVYSYEYDKKVEISCPLWTITERRLLEEGKKDLEKGKSLFDAGEYRASKRHLESAEEKFEDVQSEESTNSLSYMITVASARIFRQNVLIGMVFLAISDVLLSALLAYYWIFRKKWFRLGEKILLLNLPILLGLLQVYQVDKEYLQTFVVHTAPSILISIIVVLRQNILGFARTLISILSGHKDMLVLSIVKQLDEVYRVSVESIEEQFMPVKESKEVVFPPEAKEELIKKVEFMIEVLSQYSSAEIGRSLTYSRNILKETGSVIYKNFIPESFSDILEAKFILLEVEDIEIPWELMFSDDFFASKYAISRRIVATESVNIRQKRKNGRKALIISDPTETLPAAKTECEIIYERLERKMETILVEGYHANMGRIAFHLGQGFDIIHFAGHVDNALVLSDGIMTPEEVREYIVGTPVVIVNGCKSEELARAFLLGGAMAYVCTTRPVHDKSAAEIAADFLDLCLQYQIGEALRKAREIHMSKDLVWASLIMYGDPTLKLL